MKNIYEDGENRSDMEDIGSSGNSDGFFDEKSEGAQHRASQTAMPGGNAAPDQGLPFQYPALQLTPEQISALLGQLITAQANGLVTITPPAVSEENPINVPADGSVDPGKRIIFQSPDFEEPIVEKETASLESVIGTGSDEEQEEPEVKKHSFYDDDDLFDSEAESRRGLRAAAGIREPGTGVKATDFGSEFSISEMEIDGAELPELPERKKASVVSPKTAAPKIISEKADTVPDRPTVMPRVTGNNEQGTGGGAPKMPQRAFTSMSVEDIEEPQDNADASGGRKKLSVGEIVRRVVLTVSIIAIVIASAVLIKEYKLHKENELLEDNISNLIVDVPVEETTEKSSGKNDKDKTTAPTKDESTQTTLSAEQQWDQIKAQYPNVIFPPSLQLKYAKLYATNQDFVGYLSAEGINLSLPVVQTTDDETYLKKNFYGKSTKYGCPFVTHLNNIETLDMNTVIFGHHMNDSTVFGALDKYKSIDGFKSAPVITFNTMYSDYQWKIIAAFITNAYEKDDNGYLFRYYFTSLSTQERFSAYLNELNQRTLYFTGVDVQATDKLLTLSTCSHEFDEARFVVVARLVRPGESADVNVSLASVNSNPRYPQAYYTKKKLDNPYKDAVRWEVG